FDFVNDKRRFQLSEVYLICFRTLSNGNARYCLLSTVLWVRVESYMCCARSIKSTRLCVIATLLPSRCTHPYLSICTLIQINHAVPHDINSVRHCLRCLCIFCAPTVCSR